MYGGPVGVVEVLCVHVAELMCEWGGGLHGCVWGGMYAF